MLKDATLLKAQNPCSRDPSHVPAITTTLRLDQVGVAWLGGNDGTRGLPSFMYAFYTFTVFHARDEMYVGCMRKAQLRAPSVLLWFFPPRGDGEG